MTYISGFCGVGSHSTCRGQFHGGTICSCRCHRLADLLARVGVLRAVAVLEGALEEEAPS